MELDEKFAIPTITTDERDSSPEEFWHLNDRIVASINTAKHQSHFQHRLSVPQFGHLKLSTVMPYSYLFLSSHQDKRTSVRSC